MTVSLDFNHGALKDANGPRARDISERINAHIDAALFRTRSEEQNREYVGASGPFSPFFPHWERQCPPRPILSR